MIDQDTQNSETQNSEADQANSQSSDQSTSNTSEQNQQQSDDQDQDRIDLGEGDDQQQDQDQDQDQDQQQETDEERAAREERETMFGAPAEGENYKIEGLPEGIEIDQGALEAITPVARQLNLSDKGLSAIAQVYAKEVLPGVAQQVVDNLNNDVVTQRKTWEDEARNLVAGKGDPLATAGGEKINFGGRSLKDVQAVAAKTLDKYAPTGFRKFLDDTGLGVHPQMIAMAFQIGKDIAEDRDVEPTERDRQKQPAGQGGRPMTDPSKFYDHG